MNKYSKYALLLLIISILGSLCSVITHESVIVCDIFIMMAILLFNTFMENKDKNHGSSNRNIKKVVGWRPISEYDDTYTFLDNTCNWVLVRMFNGDFECIPRIAKKRRDGKWYDFNDNELPFEVKEFFDMEQLDKKEGL